MLLGLVFWLLSFAYAQEPRQPTVMVNPTGIVIFVSPETQNEVSLTSLIAAKARIHKNSINDSFAMTEGINFTKRQIRVYDSSNIAFHNAGCDYLNTALKCGVDNKHWTITTAIVVEDMEASFILNLHDETAAIIGSAAIPIYGWIERQPRWKRTIVVSEGMMGESKQEMFEQWPDKKIKHPPRIRSKDVTQAMISLFLSFEK